MRFGSVCSGIEAASVAWETCNTVTSKWAKGSGGPAGSETGNLVIHGTQIPYRNKPADECPDGPRYAACGNSMAVPVMRWIGKRIDSVANTK